MAINTKLSVTLTKAYLQELGFTVDPTTGAISGTPSGVWVGARWYANNDTSSGYLSLVANGVVQDYTLVKNGAGDVTGYQFTLPAFSESALVGGTMYVAAASDTSLKADPFENLKEGDLNNLVNAKNNNYTFGTFEFTLQGGLSDQGDLTAITTYGLPMSATSYLASGQVVGSVGYNIPGSQIWSGIGGLGTPAGQTQVNYDTSMGPLSGSSFAITPTTAVGGSLTSPPFASTMPFSSTNWYKYLDALAQTDGVIANISGTFNGAPAPVANWASGSNVQTNVWHNAGLFDYEVSYKTNLSVKINGQQQTISAFLLSPTEASQVKGYIVIPKGDEAGIAPQWAGGLGNSIYSTLGMAQVYAHDPSAVTGQTPFLFQDASSSNNGTASDPANTEFFNVGQNTQWGKVFTQFLTGLSAGYVGSTGDPLNPKDTTAVDLSKSWNWDPDYAFGGNLKSTPYGSGTAFQFSDPYAELFFHNTNVYGNMYSDSLSSLFVSGSPLLNLSTSTGNVDHIDVTVFGRDETPTGYTAPVIYNYPWGAGNQPVLAAPSATTGTATFVFKDAAGADGQQSFVADDDRLQVSLRVWDPTLNSGAGGFSSSATLPAFPTVKLTVTGMLGQEVPQGTVLEEKDGTKWTVTSTNNFMGNPPPSSPLTGSVVVTATAEKAGSSASLSDQWDNVAIKFPGAISTSNPSASSVDPTTGKAQVQLQFSGDTGVTFDAGYATDAAGNKWFFDGGTVAAPFTAVTATAETSGASVSANSSWDVYSNAPVTTESASEAGLLWSSYTVDYDGGDLSIINQTIAQSSGALVLTGVPMADAAGKFVWYQISVADAVTNETKVFNWYPQVNSNEQYIDGGAAITAGTGNQSTINFATASALAIPTELLVPDDSAGPPLQGTPYAPVIGTQAQTYYQQFGQNIDFAAVAGQPTWQTGGQALAVTTAKPFVFGWTGLNPVSLTDGSLAKWTNKVNGLDIVQIDIVDKADTSNVTSVFAQADIDGQWLTGLSSVIGVNNEGTHLELVSKPVSLVAGKTYEITYREYQPDDPGLASTSKSGTNPVSNESHTLTVSVTGSSMTMTDNLSQANNGTYLLYHGLLDRVPDLAGFNYWTTQSNVLGMDQAQQLASFKASDEFESIWGDYDTDVELVNAAYAFILDRAPDAEGKAYWLAELEAGRVDADGLLLSFVNSPEAVAYNLSLIADGYLVAV